MRNFASKVPKSRWHEIKPYLLMIRDAPDLEAGQKAVREFLAKFSKEFPGLCKCLTEDLDALLAQLQLPWRLRKFTRTTNLIERSFVEERRRTKTLPRFFTEKSCLKLVYAVLIRAAARWQAISITSTEYLQLRMLAEERELALPSNWSVVQVITVHAVAKGLSGLDQYRKNDCRVSALSRPVNRHAKNTSPI